MIIMNKHKRHGFERDSMTSKVSERIVYMVNNEIQNRHAAISVFVRKLERRINDILENKENRVPNKNNEELYTRLKIVVRKLTIMDEIRCNSKNSMQNKESLICSPNVDSKSLLKAFSILDHSQYCLTYLFTHRLFEENILGLAFRSAENTLGGICHSYKSFKSKSLNIGLITTMDADLEKISTIFLHEILHSFGAPHDEEICFGNFHMGNYVMYPSISNYIKHNNQIMSICTKKEVATMLHKFNRGSCLLRSVKVQICGNGQLEGTEECDCGGLKGCKLTENICCNPTRCKFYEGKSCDPAHSVCCNNDCSPKTHRDSDNICLDASECSYASRCSPQGHCVKQQKKKNFSICGKNKNKFCHDGMCTLNICDILGKTSCHTKIHETACYISCQDVGIKNAPCKSYKNATLDVLEKIRKIIGVPTFTTNFLKERHSDCIFISGSLGYCDFKYICRVYNPISALDYVNKKSLNKFKKSLFQYYRKYWWAFVLGIFGFSICMLLFIQIFAKYTPSNNPNAVPALTVKGTVNRIGTSIRRRKTIIRRSVQRTGMTIRNTIQNRRFFQYYNEPT
ncbi:hypothetical protein A3Q56_04814 [Intoshia linei]|uniref:Disintegrin and metalloproteinase domain-containing protein 10 n=1 Tax=Intoshia linei TaxID=1819745 RepID=A0A177AZI9_9BILA|nr:hypothetical protein A3Q56_04814 [Intoshia linei]